MLHGLAWLPAQAGACMPQPFSRQAPLPGVVDRGVSRWQMAWSLDEPWQGVVTLVNVEGGAPAGELSRLHQANHILE